MKQRELKKLDDEETHSTEAQTQTRLSFEKAKAQYEKEKKRYQKDTELYEVAKEIYDSWVHAEQAPWVPRGFRVRVWAPARRTSTRRKR